MKKAILPIMFSFLAFGALAQNANRTTQLTKKSANDGVGMFKEQSAIPCVTNSTPTFAHKTTSTAFWSTTFSGGSASILPFGWTTTGTPAGWKWVSSYPTSPTAGTPYPIGPIKAPASVSDGWMVYDSDSIGRANQTLTTMSATLLSPPISCVGQSTVQLSFYEWFRKFQDSCFIDVSTNGGVSWTTYINVKNNNISTNTSVPTNPYLVRLNITAAAANQNNVQIRFRYVINAAGGGYAWHIDDVQLSPLDPVDLGLENSYALMATGDGGITPIGSCPKQLADTVFPETFLSNLGALTQSNITTNAQILTTAYTGSKVFTTLPYATLDSLVDFSAAPPAGYIPTTTGTFKIAYNVNQLNDAYAGNNVDTAAFAITDSTLWGFTPGATITGGYYLHNANLPTPDFRSGFAFNIPVGKHDTLTSFSMAFHYSTHPGAGIVAQMYKENADGTFSFIVSSKLKTLTAADISTATAGGIVYTTAMVDLSSVPGGAGIAGVDLQSGFYTVLVGTDNAVDTVTIYSTIQKVDPNNDGIGVIGRSNNAGNDASVNQTCDTATYGGLTNIPVVSANFGNNAAVTLGVNNVSFVNAGQVYPNPANTVVNVPFSTNASSNVTISVTNVTGQTLKSQTFSNVTNGTAKFSTTDLSNGLYFFTIEANGSKNTGRFVVAR